VVEKKENIFLSDCDALIHGCNCFNTWGAGLAKQVKKIYPEAYKADLQTKSGDRNKLGTYTTWSGQHFYYNNKNIIVINLYSQYNFGTNIINVDYDAIYRGTKLIAQNYLNTTFALPRIGCGLARGDWNIIKEIIISNLPNSIVYSL